MVNSNLGRVTYHLRKIFRFRV